MSDNLSRFLEIWVKVIGVTIALLSIGAIIVYLFEHNLALLGFITISLVVTFILACFFYISN